MPDDQFQQIIDGFRTRLQAELDAQLRALTEHQSQTLDLVRQAAEAETEQRWASRIEDVRAEWSTRLETEVEGARSEAQRRVAEETMRVRLDAEQEAAETSARLRQELEEMRLAERRQADEALVSAQRLAEEALKVERARAETALTAQYHAEEALEAERRRADEAHEAGRRQAEEHSRVELRQVQDDLDAVKLTAEQATRQAEAARLESQQAKDALDAERRRSAEALDIELRRTEETLRAELRKAQEELDAARLRADQADKDAQAARQEGQRAGQALAAELHEERVRSERAIANAREELDTERLRAEQAVARAQTALEAERERAEQAVAEGRAALDADRRRADQGVHPSSPAVLDGSTLLEDLRAIDAAASLSDALGAAVTGASRTAPRAALFVVNGEQLEEWVVPGVPAISTGSIHVTERAAGVLGDVLRRNEPMSTGGNGTGPKAPAFAALPPGRTATAVPLLLGGQSVAVLYADEGREGSAPASWRDTIQILGSHTSACLAHLTAVRTTQAMRFMSDGTLSAPAEGAPLADDEDGARRYARLLLSEIRLYNEGTVRLGRQHGDLLQRLRPEIDRARRLYEERVSMRQRDVYFQQELVQTLADGDAALLGRPAESS